MGHFSDFAALIHPKRDIRFKYDGSKLLEPPHVTKQYSNVTAFLELLKFVAFELIEPFPAKRLLVTFRPKTKTVDPIFSINAGTYPITIFEFNRLGQKSLFAVASLFNLNAGR